jgi:hypothetical protein
VKVATLKTFLVMVKTLDKLVLTQKLVPLLSKIRTKEPAVMVSRTVCNWRQPPDSRLRRPRWKFKKPWA